MDVEERSEINVTYPVGWIDGSSVTNAVSTQFMILFARGKRMLRYVTMT